MPVFVLGNEPIFPNPIFAESNGLLAVGGDLSTERLIAAYRMGIFPWYGEGDPILWWSPDPRFVLFPREFRLSRSMRQFLKKGFFTVTFDRDFRSVIEMCRDVRRRKGEGTWISEEMVSAYCRLHELGVAHSVEVWHEGLLVGGLYGVALGRCFFGESMFSEKSNASKTALYALVKRLEEQNFAIIDCQVYTDHMRRMGARFIARKDFLEILRRCVDSRSFLWG
ncbi:MAG: leucyl/phenylalanyl-tRNA--protein transferase [Syntrophales bacterium]|nr:leucyl/phenylalanyl-tRNA--protein transferase [Syntrophales bacterium]